VSKVKTFTGEASNESSGKAIKKPFFQTAFVAKRAIYIE
jgi:hypothetical protein